MGQTVKDFSIHESVQLFTDRYGWVAARLFWSPSLTGHPLGSHGHSSAFWAAVPTTWDSGSWERPGPYIQEWTRARGGSLPDPVGGEWPGRPSLMYRQWVRVTLAKFESETRSYKLGSRWQLVRPSGPSRRACPQPSPDGAAGWRSLSRSMGRPAAAMPVPPRPLSGNG